jgi:hypothetical protein
MAGEGKSDKGDIGDMVVSTTRERNLRTAAVAYFPMFIAVLSLLTSIYNGYLNNKFVGIIQGNLGRGEYLRTCKEVIDAYFQVKFRASLISDAAARGAANLSTLQIDGVNAVNKVAALGTYLANLRDEATRVKYTRLSIELERIVRDAAKTKPDDLEKLFGPADELFGVMNTDCVNSAQIAA